MSFIRKLFGLSNALEPADLGLLHTDVHSHFIPGIDDGAATLEDALELIRGMHKMGYRKVITTPHVMSDYYKNTPEIILGGLAKVQEAVKAAGIPVTVEAAAEYYLDMELEEKIENKELLTFGDNYVLFELPFISEPPNLSSALFKMQLAGYRPVIAHPERYSFWYSDFSKFTDMRDRGVLLQLNINSLTGHYSPQTKKIAERLIKEGLIDLVGSDCHHRHHQDLLLQASKERAFHELLDSGKLRNAEL